MRIRKRWPTTTITKPSSSPPHDEQEPSLHLHLPPPPTTTTTTTTSSSSPQHHSSCETDKTPQPLTQDQVQVQVPPLKSDLQLLLVRRGTDGWILSKDDDHQRSYTITAQEQQQGQLNPKLSRDESFGVQPCVAISVSPSSPHSEKWCNEKADTKRNSKNTEARNNIWADHEGENENEFEKTVKKKRKKPDKANAMTEGARCSRVNGRGWRCCQQTIVGYSLCEHHLGKGRLSYNKKNDKQNTTFSTLQTAPSSSSEMLSRKRKEKKLGVVKARSMRSLLVQTQTQHTLRPPIPLVNSSTNFGL